LRHLLLTLAAVWELMRLGFVTRFRFDSPYWRWRNHTAFGRGMPAGGTLGAVRAVLHYGKWVHQQRMSRP